MRWVRVKINKYQDLFFPNECPNCLKTPANIPCQIQGEVTVPLFYTRSFVIDWLYCESCANLLNQIGKLWRRYSIYTFIAFAVIFAVTLIGYFKFNLGTNLIYSAIAVFVISVVVLLVAYIRVFKAIPLAFGQVRGPAIKLHHAGRKPLSFNNLLDISFQRAKYAQLFIEKNRSNNLRYNETKLKFALEEDYLENPEIH
ncbi:MAG TPA: hypothetical protein VJC37_01300 [Planctomycetota bacterium]|nr:hypothetical protein [Planctomycetota bacterium]